MERRFVAAQLGGLDEVRLLAAGVSGCKDTETSSSPKAAKDTSSKTTGTASALEKTMQEVVADLCKCSDPVCLTEVQTRAAPKLKQVADTAPDLVEKYGPEMTKCSRKAAGLPD